MGRYVRRRLIQMVPLLFGISFTTGRPVGEMILERLPATLELMSVSFVFAALIAIPLGVYSAVRQYSLFDFSATTASFLGIAMPVFWFALILQLVFSVNLGWLPTSGRDTIGDGSIFDQAKHLVLTRHAVKNALIPVVSIMALDLAGLFSGAVIAETIFAWPGIGRLFVQAMFSRDYPLLMGILMMSSFLVVFFNLIADVAYGWLDPRISYK